MRKTKIDKENNMKDIIEIGCFLIMIIIVLVSWFKYESDFKYTIAYTGWTFIVYWLNAPNLFYMLEGIQIKNNIFVLPFKLYEMCGIWYVIFGNILLAIVGSKIGNSWKKKNMVNEKKMKKMFDNFSNDASELKIIGRDLDFLNDKDYVDQREHIKKLKNKEMLLCEKTEKPELINLYHELMEDGNVVRYYSERQGIANLKAQIKIDMHTEEAGLFAVKLDYREQNNVLAKYRNRFEVTNLEGGFLLRTVSDAFKEVFENSLNPVIKCIALDLGGVYFDGDLDEFYSYLEKTYKIMMNKNGNDKLNIDDDLMSGKITIKEFIVKKTTSKFKCNNLKQEEWKDILNKWGETWVPNEKLKKLFEYIGKQGIHIVPFSNLDKDNGNKYIREHYLPDCCTDCYLSYEQKCIKPGENAFTGFYEYVEDRCGISFPYQILLIDDQDKNISEAMKCKWETIKYINKKGNEQELVNKLKRIGILPQKYKL